MTYAAFIYSHSITPRLAYIVDFLSQYYGLSFKLTSDESNYVKAEVNCKINYSYHQIHQEEIWIHPHALLFESAVHAVKIDCFQHHHYKAFFKTEGNTGFDLLAATFYLLTRYEEYLPHKKDVYGRYAHENSLAFYEEFLQLPLINIWLEDFRKKLVEKNDLFATPHSSFKFLPTYDIDMAWSYCNKGFKRNSAALLKLFFTGKWHSFSERLKVLRKKNQDPFDAYEWMDELHKQYQLQPIYFFLVAQHISKYDRNISIGNEDFKQLIHHIASSYKIALHPSWTSGDIHSFLLKEKNWLEQLVKQHIHSSRQHFIRFHLPETYRQLITAGITNDYSMGYGSINGFRASIASSFYWYDLKNEEQTKLLVHPFCFMDANAYFEQNQNTEQTLRELMRYYQTVKEFNGTLITIWHNSFLGSAIEFEGWKEIYQQFINNIAGNVQ